MSDKKLNLKWMAYRHDLNTDSIVVFNIFDHYTFADYVNSHLKKCHDKDEFAKRLRCELFYYFGHKAEYEVVIGPWIGSSETKVREIDIYEQVMNNFEAFLDYVWKYGKGGEVVIEQ